MPQATDPKMNPWHPIREPVDLKHLGKLGEELNECGAAVSRCIIQGVEECEPVTGKPNKLWLQEELADVLANIELVIDHFGLDLDHMLTRRNKKMAQLKTWHEMA
jgi:NTP pyrophosphatase (non-canonical NTP hydrolase)